jgi:outer membrane protein TolC
MNLPILLSTVVALGPSGTAPAQAQDTLHLATLQAIAVAHDTRADRAELEQRASGLRADNLGVDRLPRLQLRADAAYQSEVIDIAAGNAGLTPTPPKDRYELALDADWTLWDGGVIQAQRAAEKARLSSTLTGLEAQIYETRLEVTDAFFSALLLQEQIREADILIEDLEARLNELQIRVEQGVALPGNSASMRAERVEAEQRRDALDNERLIALGVLSQLIGRTVADAEIMALPDLDAEMEAHPAGALASETVTVLPPGMRTHPQFAAFEARRTSGDRRVELTAATARPSVSVFGQLGYGSPGFDQFNNSLHEYWRAGVNIRWAPWTWNRRRRDVEEIRVEQRLIDNQEQRFSDEMLQALKRPLRTIEYLRTALASDEEIIALRAEAEAYAHQRFGERAISAAAYTEELTNLQEARLARVRHRAELARAQAHYLITLGVELR